MAYEQGNERVDRIIRFIEILKVPSGKGSGKNFILRPWQKDFIWDVYSGVDEDGLRKIRTAIFSVARKNGKTALISALVLVHLVGPEAIQNGEIYSAANDRQQAAIVFKYAAQIVRLDEELTAAIKIVDSSKLMTSRLTGSTYLALSAEVGTKHGLSPSVVIYDELAQSKNRDLFDVLESGMGAREEPLFVIISTQSDDPQHPLSQLIDDAMTGRDSTSVCNLYAVPDDYPNALEDEKAWRLANPALGDFRSLADVRKMAARALRMPSFESVFRNLFLNQRVSSEAPLISRREWDGCLNKDKVIKPGDKIFLALDLSGRNDLTALVGVSDGEDSIIKSWLWKPEDSLKDHENRDRVPYVMWKKSGAIETTPGRVIDYDFVAKKVSDISKIYKIIGLAFDRWHIKEFIKSMERLGIECYIDTGSTQYASPDAIRLIEWGQGYRDMSPAVMALESEVLKYTLFHDGNPCLTWNMANAMVKKDPSGSRKLNKEKARFRIDGATALAMACGLKYRDGGGDTESIYETRGVVAL